MKKLTKRQELENIKTEIEKVKEELNDILKSLLTKVKTIKKNEGTLYNIHKRSIPVSIDKVVVLGVTKAEADLEVKRLIEKERIRRNQTNEDIFFFFDIISVEATPEEKSIFYNEGSPVL